MDVVAGMNAVGDVQTCCSACQSALAGQRVEQDRNDGEKDEHQTHADDLQKPATL